MLRLSRDNGKENGNYYIISGLYRDNGKENGDYGQELYKEATSQSSQTLKLSRLQTIRYKTTI